MSRRHYIPQYPPSPLPFFERSYMSDNDNTSLSFSKDPASKKAKSHNEKPKRKRINWHEAFFCAIQIDLRDYADLLEYKSEYVLGKNSYRIDLLIIRKLTNTMIPKKIASVFESFNLFEIKGIGSSATINSYYKTIGYGGLFISQLNQSDRQNHLSSMDLSLTLLSCHYPRKLMKHLIKDRKLEVEKYAPGVYHINKETFIIQIIVTKELTAEENLYLHCLTDKLKDLSLAKRLADDYKCHQKQPVYNQYMRHLAAAYSGKRGEEFMVENEWIFELCGTSSDEIRRIEAERYLEKIDKLIVENNNLSAEKNSLSADKSRLSANIKAMLSQITYLKSLLEQNNIPFDPDFEPSNGQ